MAVLRELLARFGVQFDDAELKKGSASLDTLADRIRNFAGVAAAAGLGVGIGVFINSVRQAGVELDNMSRQVGLNAESLQEWLFIAAQTGQDAGDLFGIIGSITDAAEAGAEGTNDQSKAWKQLGVSVKDARGQLKDAPTLMLEMADGLERMGNETERSALLQKLAGDDGLRLQGILRGGRKEIEANIKRFRELGGGMSKNAIDRSKELTAAMGNVTAAFESFRGLVAERIFPSLSRFARLLSGVAGEFAQMARGSHIVEAAFAVLGAAAIALAIKLAIAFAPAIATIAAIAAAVLGVILVVDDLIALFTGGQSAIGGFLDKLFGIGTAVTVVQHVRAAFMTLGDIIEGVGLAAGLVFDRLSEIGSDTVASLREMFEGLGASIASVFDEIRDVLSPVLEAIEPVFNSLGELSGLFGLGENLSSAFQRNLARVQSEDRMVSVDRRVDNQSRTLSQTNNITINASTDGSELQSLPEALTDALNQQNQAALAALVPEAG